MSSVLKKIFNLIFKPYIIAPKECFAIVNKLLEPGTFRLVELDLSSLNKIKPLLKKSKQSVLVVNYTETLKQVSDLRELIKDMNLQAYLVLNYDEERIRELKNEAVYCLTYGFQKKADIYVTDIDSQGTNFKINYQGNIVPFWFKQPLKRKEIYNILSAVAVGLAKNINLVEISQILSVH